MPLAIFGIENTALNLVVTILVLVLVAVWLALIAFTFTDARRRISDPFLVGCATAASLFPFIGTLVYSILRPPEFLEDVRERETEIRESEIRLRHLEHSSCHKCGTPTESDFLRCPACRTRLKNPCPECTRPVGIEWKLCPYCEKTLVAPRRSSRSGSREGGSSSGRAPSRSAGSGRQSRSERPRKPVEETRGERPRPAVEEPRKPSPRKQPARTATEGEGSAATRPARRRRRVMIEPDAGPGSTPDDSTVADSGDGAASRSDT